MDIEGWLSEYSIIATSELASSESRSLVNFIERYAFDISTFIEARHGKRGELVVLDIRTGRPQKSAYPILVTERVAVRFANGDETPFVYMLREDFPDTAHQQLTIEGAPRAICIDDRSWAEARLTWTPAEFIRRILSWFSRAARGALHDARQPLEPLMIGDELSFLISRDVLQRAAELDLVGVVDKEHRQMVRVMPLDPTRLAKEDELLCLVAYGLPPEQMRRLTFAPNNLGSLADMLAERGIDLFTDLRERFSKFLDALNPLAWRINSRFAVIVEMPVIAPDGAVQDGVDLRAFLTDQWVGEIAVALGVAMGAKPEEGSSVGYVKSLVPGLVDDEAVRAIFAQSAQVHYEFDRLLATQLRGRADIDERDAVLVGAGAIGSHIADCLIREGRFRWTVVDHDRLLPHNLARHTGRAPDVTKAKAAIVASALSQTLYDPDPIARPIVANVRTEGPEREDIDRTLAQTDLVIDATASVVASRYLSDHQTDARRVSVFFNPVGDSAVLLAEPADRSLTLRDLEAQYLGYVARDNSLIQHLASPDGTFAYTGACRAITNQIPQSRVLTLSGLVSGGLGSAVDRDAAVIKIWTIDERGGVAVHDKEPAQVAVFRAGDWVITIDQALIGRIWEMRKERLPQETGGVLIGVVDIPAQRIHLVDAASAPPDSSGSKSGFTRGVAGVGDYLNMVQERTKGQVRYVGEWHSHPPRITTRPSTTDLAQIDWLASLFDMDLLPVLMLVAGDQDTRIIFANRQAEPVGKEAGGISRQAAGE